MKVERITVHVSDDTGRIAMYEKRTIGSAADDHDTASVLTRYIYSNHLGSAALELDQSAAIISYEEYHPYGTTSYQETNVGVQAVAKRYRWTGKERDEETGLYYHGARYYIPWLARWSAVDPLQGEMPEWSPYNYGYCNPITWTDPTGRQPKGGENEIINIPAGDNQTTFRFDLNAKVIWKYSYDQDSNTMVGEGGMAILDEVVVTPKDNPENIYILPGDFSPDTPMAFSLKAVIEDIKNVKDLISNAARGYKEVSKAIKNFGYAAEAVDESVDIYRDVKKDIDFLKVGIKDIRRNVPKVDHLSTVYEIGTKGPAYVTPATGMISEYENRRAQDVMSDVAFQEALSKGYSDFEEFINTTGNVENIGFAYSTGDITGIEGVTFGEGNDSISLLDAALTTSNPKPLASLAYAEEVLGIKLKYAFWGHYVGDKLKIQGKFLLK